ncbi:D-alanine--D-alanine ligase [Mesorhizobium sp.]|uniref:D-alanine--D-alanine ligase family protein n=1 Tax=Mesorhizobium sp. TaxID=1871066 RepID=UPI000FE7247F|nr:D-alanine--D-alanine ligase [Mesorhizobium sp.]RWK73218.1 MAG: D-alanine--D-alanine ligase [Mesorhizobium sp.]RWP77127.1 MAG: D-alanine--D-alanine ligase [Mesorhizobium sp.]
MGLQVSFIFGGISTEYDSSVSSLVNIISTYLELPVDRRSFQINNIYHLNRQDGLIRKIPLTDVSNELNLAAYVESNVRSPGETILRTLDAIDPCNEYLVNLLHGQFGEDGGIQWLAALLGLKGAFGDPHVASLTMNKYAMSLFVSSQIPADIVRIPETRLIKSKNVERETPIASSIKGPVVVKPNSLGSSILTEIFDDSVALQDDISGMVSEILRYDSAALLQEYIPGSEYSCGCIVGSSGIILLPVVEIKTQRRFFGSKEKNSNDLYQLRVVDDNDEISVNIKYIANRIADSLDLYNIARFDFRVNENSEVYFLECNYLPGLGAGGIFPTMLQSHGMTLIDMIDYILDSPRSSFAKRLYLGVNDVIGRDQT